MTGGRRSALLLGWTASLAAGLAALHAVGGPLAPPPLSDPGGLGPWLAARRPEEAAFAGVRLAALALGWYLAAATAAGVLARASGAAALVRATDAVSVALVRRVVHGAVGLSLLAGATVASPPPALAHDGAAAGATVEGTGLAPGGAAPSPPPTMRLLPSTGPGQEPPAPPDPPPAAGADRPWTVRPGDHLWGMAEQALAEAWGRPPTDAEVDPYWRAVVEANRARLRDPANPDLVFPGQVLIRPAPPGPPAGR